MSTITETVQTSAPVLFKPVLQDGNHQEEKYKYTHLLPTFSSEKYPPLEPFAHTDPGRRALSHPDPQSFLKNATRIADIQPVLGTDIEGVNLKELDSDGRDQLALFVAQRGLVVFRGQEDFIDSDIQYFKSWGRHFGRLHIHPTSAHPEGVPELHLVYRDVNHTFNLEDSDSITSTAWHTDLSFELQPPGLTTFFLTAQPKTGGDTIFNSQVAALRRLSPQFVAFLRTLKAVHSGFEQAEYSRSGKRGGIVRREPVEHVHPVIQRHPVTGEEALYVNKPFTRRIVGLKREESDNILNFLYDHIAKGADSQARVKWSPNTVVVWDNRILAHTVTVDYGESKERRHGARITPQAERPIPALEGLQLDE